MKLFLIPNMLTVSLQVEISLQVAMLEQIIRYQPLLFMLMPIIGIIMVQHLAVHLIVMQMLAIT